MKVYSIDGINFLSKTKPVRTSIDSTKTKAFLTKSIDIPNKKNCYTRKDFYNHIDGYLQKNYTKSQYLKLFSENTKLHKLDPKFNAYEKKYIDDIMTTMDLLNKKESIPDKYLTEMMQNLLKITKK